MKLPAKTTDLTTIPEPFRGSYSKDPVGGTYVLGDVEIPDVVPPPNNGDANHDTRLKEMDAKLKEFRENNNQLKKQLDSIDPEKYKAAMAALEQLKGAEEKELLSKGDINALREKWFSQERSDREKLVKTLNDQREAESAKVKNYHSKLSERTLKGALADELGVAKVSLASATAMEDAIRRGANVFSVDDEGELVAKDRDGGTKYNKDGKAYTPKDFVQDLIDTAPHLFAAGSGGGAQGASGGRVPGRPGVVIISRNDPVAFGKWADKAAKGEVTIEFSD